MKYTILLTKENPGQFRAIAVNLPTCQVQAKTRDEALNAIRDLMSRFLSQTEIVQLEIPNSPYLEETPWQWFGAFQDDLTGTSGYLCLTKLNVNEANFLCGYGILIS